MQKPDESLEDYVVPPVIEPVSKPPRPVSLQRTGEVEVLNPLARSKSGTDISLKEIRARRSYQPLWFRNFLAVGSFALLLIAVSLVSAILVGINDELATPDIATNIELDKPAPTLEPYTFDHFSSTYMSPAAEVVEPVRRSIRRKRARVSSAAVKARRPSVPLRSQPQAEVPKFAPTTLIIYAENGVINTRVEQGFQATYKKPPGLITY